MEVTPNFCRLHKKILTTSMAEILACMVIHSPHTGGGRVSLSPFPPFPLPKVCLGHLAALSDLGQLNSAAAPSMTYSHTQSCFSHAIRHPSLSHHLLFPTTMRRFPTNSTSQCLGKRKNSELSLCPNCIGWCSEYHEIQWLNESNNTMAKS